MAYLPQKKHIKMYFNNKGGKKNLFGSLCKCSRAYSLSLIMHFFFNQGLDTKDVNSFAARLSCKGTLYVTDLFDDGVSFQQQVNKFIS